MRDACTVGIEERVIDTARSYRYGNTITDYKRERWYVMVQWVRKRCLEGQVMAVRPTSS